MALTFKAPSKAGIRRIELALLFIHLPMFVIAMFGIMLSLPQIGGKGLSDTSYITIGIILPLALFSLYIACWIDEQHWHRLWLPMLPIFIIGILGLSVMSQIFPLIGHTLLKGTLKEALFYCIPVPITLLGFYKCYRFIRILLYKDPA